jgi:hypothetical protein
MAEKVWDAMGVRDKGEEQREREKEKYVNKKVLHTTPAPSPYYQIHQRHVRVRK